MENKLTNEEIERVFAMYIPCKILNGIDGDLKLRDLKYTNINTYAYCKIAEPKLLLTLLSAITDEHAAELSEALFPDGNIYDYLHGAPTGRAIVASIKNNRQTNTFYPHARIFDGFQYLIQKNYAVPLFLGINHWANGKTAIELGIAIDKKAVRI